DTADIVADEKHVLRDKRAMNCPSWKRFARLGYFGLKYGVYLPHRLSKAFAFGRGCLRAWRAANEAYDSDQPASSLEGRLPSERPQWLRTWDTMRAQPLHSFECSLEIGRFSAIFK